MDDIVSGDGIIVSLAVHDFDGEDHFDVTTDYRNVPDWLRMQALEALALNSTRSAEYCVHLPYRWRRMKRPLVGCSWQPGRLTCMRQRCMDDAFFLRQPRPMCAGCGTTEPATVTQRVTLRFGNLAFASDLCRDCAGEFAKIHPAPAAT